MANEARIVLASRRGGRHRLPFQPPPNWTVQWMALSTLFERDEKAAITVVESEPGEDPQSLQSLAETLGQRALKMPGNDFLVWVVKSEPRTRQQVQFYRNLLQHFPEPSHVEIVRFQKDLTSRLKQFIAKVEVLSARHATKESGSTMKAVQVQVSAPRPSPLDSVKSIVAATKDLRTRAGQLSATRIADRFGVPPSRLAHWLGRSRQSLLQNPAADSLQSQLDYFERIARLGVMLQQDDFRKWLRMGNSQLVGRRPLDLIAEGKWQVIADLVDDMLVGMPT